MLVMASTRQRDFSALQPHREWPYGLLPTGAKAAQLAAGHTGALPLLAGSSTCLAATACDDAFGAAVIRVETVR